MPPKAPRADERVRGVIENVLRTSGASFQESTTPEGPTQYTWTASGSDIRTLIDLGLRISQSVVKDFTGATKVHYSPNYAIIDATVDFKTPVTMSYFQFMQKFEPDFPQLELNAIDEPTGAALSALIGLYSEKYDAVYLLNDFPAGMIPKGQGQRIDIVTRDCHFLSIIGYARGEAMMSVNYRQLNEFCANIVDASLKETLLPQWTKNQSTGDVIKYKESIEEADLQLREYEGPAVKSNLYLLYAVGVDIVAYSIQTFEGVDVWRASSGNVKRLLETAIENCSDWRRRSESILSQAWTSLKGKYEDVPLTQFVQRLTSILDVRQKFDQLCQDLTKQEIVEMRVDNIWQAFDGMKPFDIKHTIPESWDFAVSDFQRRTEPLEQRVAGKLRQRLQNCQGQTQALLQEFMNMADLLALCPRIRQELSSERDTLLAKLSEKVQTMKQDFEVKSQRPDSASTWEDDRRRQIARYVPAVINRLVWARQIRCKVQQIHQYSGSILKELVRADKFSDQCEKLAAEIMDFERETFNTWVFDVKERISGRAEGAISVHTAGPLTELDQKGRLQVNYSEKLVELTKEARQFMAYGFKVPQEILTVVNQAQQFYRQAVVLRQVANVYNNLEKHIIPCTRTMLLDAAVQFENIVAPKSEKKRITWSNVADAEGHVRNLQASADTLITESRRIRSVHQDLVGKVIELMNSDLVKTPEKWKRTMRDIRHRFEILARDHGYKFEDMERWHRHWDFQIYKSLEHQYQVGLESLNENMSEIKIDLTFREGQVAFRPSLEQARYMYYCKLRDFVSLPLHFVGVGDNKDVYRQMVNCNDKSLLIVYQKAAEVFSKVAKVKKKFRDHLLLGYCGHNNAPALEEFVKQCLTDVQHWEMNFRMLKQKGKELAQIESTVKIDCIAVSTLPLKSAIEEQLNRLGALLITSLRQSATGNLEKIDTFLNTASSVIETQATTLEDITKANKMFAELSVQKPNIESEFQRFEAKNRLLRSVAGSSIDSSVVQGKWETFVTALDSHEKIMESHLARMKAAVDSAVQKYISDVQKFAAHWHELKPKGVKGFSTKEDIYEKAIKFVRERSAAFATLKNSGTDIINQCEYFKMPAPDLSMLDDLSQDVAAMEKMWGFYEQFDKDIDVLRKEQWFTLRTKLYRFEDFIKEWSDKIKDSQPNDVVLYLRSLLDEWNHVNPMLKLLRGEGMTPEHWQTLFGLLGLNRSMTADALLFGDIIDKSSAVLRCEKDLKALHARVLGELQLREALHDVRNWSRDAVFTLVQASESGRVRLITDWKDLVTAVSDNQSLLGSLKDSPYFAPFADEANKWEARFVLLDEYLHLLNHIQRKWVYLEPIFARGALPQEQPRFKSVDREFVVIMSEIEKDPHVMTLAGHVEYKDKLKLMLEQLERCQKALNEFLETKRDRFPRFYFIGDDDLLEILGQSQNPNVIQSHLKKLFMGINTVVFDKGQKNILSIVSSDGELVPLSKPVQIVVEVEDWLGLLDREMRSTLQTMLVDCVKEPNIMKYPSQILGLAEMISFTQMAEDHIKKKDFKNLRAYLIKQLRDNTSFQSDGDVVSDLKMKALILDVIHHIDIVDQLMAEKVEKETDWTWQKQLRFYVSAQSGNEAVVRMADAKFRYTYEYQGNAPKLVYTPLTDKCYLTLTQGMHLGYGGNPYGPAGTGKTESVKALGNLLGRQVLVFNCDEGIDFKSMGRIFIGLVKCGSWGCFDEFNRLKVDQLSAISQMIQVIQEALKNNEDSCDLLGRNVQVNPNAGIFVTLNPAGKGYGGRSKLPDNLKQLFRAVAMTVPDNELIAETILYSEGFENGKALAKKLVEVFRLSKQLLSNQQHYDWGLRPLKAVLRLGGVLVQQRRKERAANAEEVDLLVDESELIIKSLMVNTLSKLTFDDAKLFNALIQDVFPGIQNKDIVYDKLKPAIIQAFGDLKLQVVEIQVQKILQLYEALRQRMGVVLVGPSGSGKSTLLKVLRRALQRLGVTVPNYVMNPKAMPRTQLLGHMDLDTREWYDGVLTAAARKVVKEPSDVMSWIFCDGDIDPEWVESLNSVLDDNKLLTMPNGVRIQFGSNVNFVFETHSLQYASPATVSRMGIIFLSEEDVSPEVVVKSWLNELPLEQQGKIQGWIEENFYKAIDEVINTKSLCVATSRMGLVMSGLSHLRDVTTRAEFAIGLIRGLGCYVTMPQRDDFARDIFNLVRERPADPRRPLDSYFDTSRMSLQTYTYETTFELTLEDLQGTPMVKTVDVQRVMDNLQPWLQPNYYRPFILVGPEGCGKTMILKNCFAQVKGCRVAIINCNAQTVASHVIQKLTQMCQVFSTTQGRVLRPREGDRLILFLKDLNLPKPDKYGTVQLHSFLQQLILYQGYYDKDLEWVGIEKVQIVASMNPAGGIGRHPVAERFIAIVSVLYIAYPSKQSLDSIYNEIVYCLLSNPPLNKNPTWGGGKGAPEISKVVTSVFEQVQRKFNVDDHSHYIFTPRDITKWVLNLFTYDMENADLLDVMAYEGQRVFSDRLVSEDARHTFDKILFNALTPLYYGKPPTEDRRSKMFISWLSETKGKVNRRLQPMTPTDFKAAMEQAVMLYRRHMREIDVFIIPEILMWTARVDRVLSQPGGHLLFVGRTGVGRLEVVTIACFQLKMTVRTLRMSLSYDVKSFRMDLREVVLASGIQGENMVLVIEDHNIVDPTFLEMLNSLISSGEVPGLFTHEELEPQLQPLKDEAAQEGFMESTYNYFVTRVQRNLHIVLLMDPTHAQFQLRCQSNPALYTRCHVAWMGTWSIESMKLLPQILLKAIAKHVEKTNEGNREAFNLGNELVEMHQSQYNNGGIVSPQNFVQLMNTYNKLYTEKNQSFLDSIARLQSGLSKLQEAEAAVETIRVDVTQKKKELEVKQKEADDALNEIQTKMGEASVLKEKVQSNQKALDDEQAVIQTKKVDIDKQLSLVQPMIDQAREAVGSIKSENLNEIRSFTSPPDAIRDVLEGVLMMLGIYDTSWASMKKFLGQRTVKDTILQFNARELPTEVRDNVSKLLETKATSFKPEVIARASVAAAPLAAWVRANIEYSKVVEKIAPLEKQQKAMEERLSAGRKELEKGNEKLQKIDKRVEDLKKSFQKRLQEAEQLRDRLEKAQGTLDAAQELLGKLGSEKSRWSEQVAAIQKNIRSLPKLVLLSAGFITYLAKESENVRQKTLQEWQEKIGVSDYKFAQYLVPESKLLEFKGEGLPGDDLSQENAVVIMSSTQTPLVIDPASQAVEWVKNHLKKRNVSVDVCTVHDERFSTTLELAVRFGKTLLICEVDKLEPTLYPIIRKELIADGPKKVVQIGDRQVDWADSFQLFLFSRDSSIRLPPDARSMVSMVNFSITRNGLEAQLLGQTIKHEQPELEQQKSELLKQEEDLKVQLSDLEESLLRELASSQGSLLENKALVDSLNQIKTQATTISAALDKSYENQVELDTKRNAYRPFAHQGSTLFFLIRDMSSISPMYRFSLGMFLELFHASLEQSRKNNVIGQAEKIKDLCSILGQKSFLSIARGLFKEHRLLFGMHVVKGLHSDICTQQEWDFFIGKNTIIPDTKGDVPTWVDSDSIISFHALKTAMPQLIAELRISETDTWYRWMRSATPEMELPPMVSKLTMFQQLIVIQTFRSDRLAYAMTSFVCQRIGISSLAEVTTIAHIAKETKPSEPILLLTTPGADPSMEVQDVAYSVVGRARFHQVALGGGQTDAAMQLVHRCAKQGEWVFLKNLHLVISWAGVLEKEINTLEIHPEFRLWLTSESHDEFPAILLSSSLKITFEAPPGIKQNLLRTYDGWNSSYINSKSVVQASSLCSLAWFHAVVQERRNYIPQGWTKFYEFSQADLRSAADVIMAQIKSDVPDWATIRGILANAIYGGRMDNEYDYKVLKTYLATYFNDEVLGIGGKRTQKSLTRGVIVPQSREHPQYMSFVNALPDGDVPATFFMPSNSERVVQRVQVGKILADLVKLREVSSAGLMGKEEWANRLHPILTMWDALCTPNAAALQFKATGRNKDKRPIEGFIQAELDTALLLVQTVETTMASLKKVIEGTALLTGSLREQSSVLIEGSVPNEWQGFFTGPEVIAPWLRMLVSKAVAIHQWNARAQAGSLLRDKLVLADLFRPQTFLNALRQQTARQTGEALVNLSLDCSWNEPLTSSAVPVCLEGLYLQGARFDENGFLADVSADGVALLKIKDCHIGWVPAKALDGDKSDAKVGLPVYINTTRENLLIELPVPCQSVEKDKWILSSVAILLEP